MSDTIIKIENLSKQYRLGVVGTRTLTGDVQRWMARIRGKEDPFLKIGEENKLENHSGKYMWALRDINLEVKRGEVVGIIGKNGAGKSTLLKILSRVTGPTTGSIKTRGRIASLLEVGTGFHPELTGRENIFLNGAILGMTRQEVNSNLDEIVSFAGVEKYLYTPVKRYSSGMYVRLAFAVAAHLEPDILVVDEVLAVGDAEFQKKAIGKMQDVSQNNGRTVLFVSHNMASVKEICNRGVLLKNGKIDLTDEINKIIDSYLLSSSKYKSAEWQQIKNPQSDIFFTHVAIKNKKNEVVDVIGTNEAFYIFIEMQSYIHNINSIIAVQFNDVYGNAVLTTSSSDYENRIDEIYPGRLTYKIFIDMNIFMPGTYKLIIACFESDKRLYDIIENELSFKIEDLGTRLINRSSKGVVFQKYKWIRE